MVTGRTYAVEVFTDWGSWRAWAPGRGEGNPHDAWAARIDETGRVPVLLAGNEFYWVCPGCGGTAAGTLGDTPVSGWDAPRWVLTGTPDRPTLTPSLGCPGWRAGRCDGHWWLRDGALEHA